MRSTAPDRCLRCGAVLPSEGEPEACLVCLMQLGLETGIPSGTRFGPYEIVEPIGAGGMGEVYRARDERLKREVAIKVLPASFSTDPDRVRRFEKEAQAASALNHSNIMSVYDIGSHDGSPYIVSELLEGETLRARLLGGPLTPRKAADYAAQIARGLAAAHAKGIVHRDLKPENLFVTKGEQIKILDFGLAKLVQAAEAGGPLASPRIASAGTEPGVVLGTLGYMSPEQVKGNATDARSDIFSLGTILYEMLTAKRAFQRDSAAETISAILKEEPPELSDSGRRIPSALDKIVRRCLEKSPDNRFQSAEGVASSLTEQSFPTVASGARFADSPAGKWQAFITVLVLVALAGSAVFVLRRPHRGASEAGRLKRVAVLPFENLGASEDDYFADGIADAVRGKLTSLPGVQVIARGSSTPYRKTTKTQSQIAHELDVQYLLTATVRWQRGPGGTSRVEVSPELVEVPSSGTPTSKWQQPFDAALTDVFQVQSDIATQVAQSLGPALAAGEMRRLSETPTRNLNAYDAFLKGEDASKGMGVRNVPALRKALGFYEEAVALDPGFAQAWARASQASSGLYFARAPTPELAERARRAAEKAVALAPDRPEGYLALGQYERTVAGDVSRALALYTKGRRLAPGNPDLLSAIAGTERSLGRWDAAVEHLRQAERLDPRSVLTAQRLGAVLFLLRRYPEAREVYDRGLALAPANLDMIESKVTTFLGQGDLVGARAVLSAAPREIEPTALVAYVANSVDLGWVLDEPQRELLLRLTPSAFDDNRAAWGICLAQGYALKGDAANARVYAEEARKAFEEQVSATPEDPQSRVFLGLALAYLGRKEEAIREGERGTALLPVTKEAASGTYLQHQLVRIYMLVGEPEKALDRLEPLLKIPSGLSPAWLAIDPNFDPLRKNPRFQQLAARGK